MKKILLSILSVALLNIASQAQVAINTNGSLPDSSAMLDINSTAKGILIPRMTRVQRNAIPGPATGLMIYQTDNSPGFYYNSGTAAIPVWLIAGTGSGWGLTGNSGTSEGVNFIGTTDLVPLIFKVNNQKAGYIDFDGIEANTCFGFQSLNLNTTGWNNTAFGFQVLSQNINGYNNTAYGMLALSLNIYGYRNTAIGTEALYANTTGHNNTALGEQALKSNISGNNNTATGALALQYNSGDNNTSTGYQSLYLNDGDYNTANGSGTLAANSSGNYNTATGVYALNISTTGNNNTASGYAALTNNVNGHGNTASGINSLYDNVSGDNNSAFGRSAFFNSGTLNNTTCIGYNAGGAVNENNRVEIGNTSVTDIVGQVGFGTYSDGRIKDKIKEDIPGLAFITKLRPVTYNLNIHRQNAMVYKGTKKDEDNWDSKYDIEMIRMTGFIAQDVEKAAKEVGYDFSGVQAPVNPDELYALRYSDFVVPLVKAVQELNLKISQLENLKMENEEMKKQNAELLKRIEKLETR